MLKHAYVLMPHLW